MLKYAVHAWQNAWNCSWGKMKDSQAIKICYSNLWNYLLEAFGTRLNLQWYRANKPVKKFKVEACTAQMIQMIKLVPRGTDGRLPLSDLDLDLGSGHTAYRRASLVDLYLRTKFHWDRKEIFFLKITTEVLVKFRVTWHKKLGQISEIRPDQI